MRYAQLISVPNLELAWRRITTGQNLHHKRFFRHLYRPYELGLADNLRHLHDRLVGNWHASQPQKVFLPKPSGLLRPITLLRLEDQIVFQAIANLFADRLRPRREIVVRDLVFSNCLNPDPKSIFFMEDWRSTYSGFKHKLKRHIDQGYTWVAEFDLAAFYDTISHDCLIRIIAPRSDQSDLWKRVRDWLQTWGTHTSGMPLRHGIPQGPIASDFLAECYLLPLDERMKSARTRYIRYVDDIRILARTEREVYMEAVRLELACRELGLIPQSAKFKVKRVKTIKEALGSLPSLAESGRNREGDPPMSRRDAERIFKTAVGGRPLGVKDKSRARYALYRSPRSPKMLEWVLRLLPRHPEHVDAFAAFLGNYDKSQSIEKALAAVIKDRPPNDYFLGELWQVLSTIASVPTLRQLLPRALDDFKRAKHTLAPTWGAAAFLLRCDREGLARVVGRVNHLDPLIKSLVMDSLPPRTVGRNKAVVSMLSSGEMETGLALVEPLLKKGITLGQLGLRSRDLAPQVASSLGAIGLTRRRQPRVDQIGILLADRYGVVLWTKWRQFLKAEYLHALQILQHADALYESNRSEWMQSQNSFHDAIARRLLPLLNPPINVRNKNGELIDLGVLLQPNGPFDRAHPVIGAAFKGFNDRRNGLPGSHPYAKKTGKRAAFLKAREQQKFANSAANAYAQLIILLDTLI